MFVDDVHVRKVADALWASSPSGRASLLVGAGFSRNATPIRSGASVMPGWSDLYELMVEQLYPAATSDVSRREWLLGQAGATSAFLRVAEEFKAQFGRTALDELIIASVPDDLFAPGDLHSQLMQLPWSDVLTTNWDTLLERSALTLDERVYDLVLKVEDIPTTRAPRIVKLHGSLPSHRPFIFTEEDFRTYPVRFAPFINLARQSAMENALVLLGFSGEDPNFLFWSGWVRDQLGESAPFIYLVGALDLSPSRRKMLESQKIQPIDLAHLPEFDSWPQDNRISLANQWFLETLRASEPYRSDRWPRPKAALSPPLKLVSTPIQVHAPSPEPEWGADLTSDVLRALTEHWGRNRRCYPGWVVPPTDNSSYLWAHLGRRLDDIVRAISALPLEERIEPLFELNWQLEAALVPLSLTIDDLVIETLNPVWADNSGRSARSPQVVELSLAALRHGREVGDGPLFEKIELWLRDQVEMNSRQASRHYYERCQFLRAQGDYGGLEIAVEAWTVSGDPIWLVRKAGLLADLGRDEEAGRLALDALKTIRREAKRGKPDIASWSRESLAMLFRWFFSHAETGNWENARVDREQFDERQHILASRGSSHRDDYFALRQKLESDPPALKSLVERRRRFDLGAVNTKLHLAGEDPRVTRLAAYSALRFQEECGIPARLGHLDTFGKTLERVAAWLVDIDPQRAFEALLRTLPQSGESLDQILSRRTVASLEATQANALIDHLLQTARVALKASQSSTPVARHWMDRLKSTIELLSRLVLRVPERAEEVMTLAREMFAHPQTSRRVAAGDVLQTVLKRVVDLLPADDASAAVLELMSLPLPSASAKFSAEHVDPAEQLHWRSRAIERTSDWDEPIGRIFAGALESDTRKAAIQRLEVLWQSGLLNEKEREEFGAVLWAPEFLKDGVPNTGFYLPAAFLFRPHPTNVEVELALAAAFITDKPLDDAELKAGRLESLVGTRHFDMTAEQVREQLLRLATYCSGHPEPPDHPLAAAFERPNDLVDGASALYAALCRRALGNGPNCKLALDLASGAHFPLRIEPALFSLVKMGFDQEEGLSLLRRTLDDDQPDDSGLRETLLSEFLKLDSRDEAFETRFWEELFLRLIARTQILPQLLRFLTVVVGTCPERLAVGYDRPIAFMLERLLTETSMQRDDSGLAYDSLAARYWAASLASRMGHLGRVSQELNRAWEVAADEDPLPDAKQARVRALEEPAGD